MLWEEADWVGKTIVQYTQPGQNLLNIGSSNLEVRTTLQPHMEKFIFEPLRINDVKVTHTDIQNASGVDIVGDLTDPQFVKELKGHAFDIVMCCNLLEHLSDRSQIIASLNQIVPDNGYFLVTVPFHYPYHLDPIDTMYRPTVNELRNVFPAFEMIEGLELTAQRAVTNQGKITFHSNYFQQLLGSPGLFFKLMLRCLFPFYKPRLWWITIRDLFFMFRKFKVTCVLFKKSGASQ